MNTQNTEHEFGTYKYHMERSKFWADKALTRKNREVANADMRMSEHHLLLAFGCKDN